MTVDRREVERIGSLARLQLDEAEVVRLTDEMNRILAHAERLKALEAQSSVTEAAETELDEAEADDAEAAEVHLSGGEGAEAEADEGEVPEGEAEGGPPMRGVRLESAEEPDALGFAMDEIAPHMADGFFLVPPPPGVSDAPSDDG